MGKNQFNKKKRDSGKTIEVLFNISEAVTNTRNLDELYKVIHNNLSQILNVDNFYIALYDQKKDVLTFPYHVDEKAVSPIKIVDFSNRLSSAGIVINSKKPKIFRQKDIVRLAVQPKDSAKGMDSKIWLGAPLIIDDKVKGAIVVQSYESPTAYEKVDLDLLNSVSQHIALAIERKESDEKLTEQKQILEKILESSPVGIALVQNRVFKWVNNEMVRMFGYQSKLDFKDKSARIIYQDIEDYESAGKKIKEGLSTRGTADYEINLVKKDMTIFPAHIRLNCGNRATPMAWTIATFTDISQRKAAEIEKYERERLQGVLEMAGAVCHEINQPLQAILGYSELLLLGSGTDISETNNVSSIKTQATRLGKITRKLSNITQYKTVDYPGNTKIVDIWSAASTETEH